MAKVAKETGIDSGIVKELLAHSNLATIEQYMGNFDTLTTDNPLINLFDGIEKPKDKKEEVIEALKGMSPEDIAAIISAIKKIVIFAGRQIAHVELSLGARFLKKFDRPTNNS